VNTAAGDGGSCPLARYVESWAPQPVVDTDPLHSGPVEALSSVLGLPGAPAAVGDALPPLWHWLYFLSWPAQRDLGGDGHPSHGRFLPPLPDRQRMWAGGRCEITEPLRLGEPAERTSTLVSAVAKRGRTGEMLFVTERRAFRQNGRACLVEEQDIVYRSGRSRGRHPEAVDRSTLPVADEPWRQSLRPDPALLFRFSALTANAHRIHYDADYCRDQEGYPGLVVHGPLLALLMVDLVRRHAAARPVRSLSFRFLKPVFAGEHLVACGTGSDGHARLRVATHRETRHATAEVVFA
jgi:itaconyl-CoA hydratase / mesaconyl-C4 CoA hydratase